MVIEQAVVKHLEDDAGVAGIVDDRIYPNVIPQDVDLPAIAYQVISRPGLMCHDGPSGIAWPRFQITAQANDPDEVIGLINLVRVAFDGFTGLMGGGAGVEIEGSFVKDVRDGWQFATERATRRLDFVIHHQE